MDGTRIEIMAEKKAPAMTERMYFTVPWSESALYPVGQQLNVSISPCPNPAK